MEKNENVGILAKFEMRGIERVLEGEEVIDAISGTVGISQKGVKQKEELCVLVLTPTRVILYHKKIMGHSSIDFQLSKINNVVLDTGLVYADIKIHSGDDIITLKKAIKTVGERFAKNIKIFISKVNNPTSTYQSIQPSPASQTPNIDIADQIKKLADLKAQGFLTEEEFTTQKKKLLGL